MDGQTLAAALALMKAMPNNAASSAAQAAASAEAAQTAADSVTVARLDETYEYFGLGQITERTAAGAVAAFDTGIGVSIPSVRVGIEPVQAGSGDPSPDNVRPITGWTGAKVTRTGKNLAYVAETQIYQEQQCTRAFANGGLIITSAGGNYGRVGLAFSVKAGVQYTISLKAATNERIIRIGLSSENTWKYTYGVIAGPNGLSSTLTMFSKTITAVSDTLYLECYAGTSGRILTIEDIQLELGSTATAYEPYSGQTYSITFPTEAGTVYGGSLDVTNGVLTVDRIIETKTWSELTSSKPFAVNTRRKFIFSNAPKYILTNASEDLLCNLIGTYDTSYSNDFVHMYIANSEYAWVFLPSDTDADTAIQLSYTLATPITYQLTPQQITALVGQNNVWSDAGDVTVTYWA